MKRNLGMSAREKRVSELAALVVKAALDDLPNNWELCEAIVQSASLRLAIKRNQNAAELLKAEREAYDALPWWKRMWKEAP